MSPEKSIPELPAEIGLPDAPTSRSSVFEKTTPELRRKLDRAILNYEPVGYRETYKKYGLPDLGVSFTAFYYYASRLRARAATIQLASEVLPSDGPSLVDILPDLISQHLVEQIMANDSAGADTIYRLTLAHRAALENAALMRKHRDARAVAAARSEPLPQGSAEWPSNKNNPSPPSSSPMAHLSNTDLVALYDRVVAAQQASLAADEEKAVARFEKAKENLVAMGYPVANVQTLDELEEIIQNTDPNVQQPPPALCSASQISNLEISNSVSLPAPNPENPVHSPPPIPQPLPPTPSNLCSSASSAEKISDTIVSTADDEFRITPEERRRRELHRVMINFGLLKPDAPLPDSSG